MPRGYVERSAVGTVPRSNGTVSINSNQQYVWDFSLPVTEQEGTRRLSNGFTCYSPPCGSLNMRLKVYPPRDDTEEPGDAQKVKVWLHPSRSIPQHQRLPFPLSVTARTKVCPPRASPSDERNVCLIPHIGSLWCPRINLLKRVSV